MLLGQVIPSEVPVVALLDLKTGRRHPWTRLESRAVVTDFGPEVDFESGLRGLGHYLSRPVQEFLGECPDLPRVSYLECPRKFFAEAVYVFRPGNSRRMSASEMIPIRRRTVADCPLSMAPVSP